MSLSVENLKVYYRSLKGDVQALEDVTFSTADGEIMGLAGESGCGKSTLGKALIKLDTRMRWVEGHVTLDGRELPIRVGRFEGGRFESAPLQLVPVARPSREELASGAEIDTDVFRHPAAVIHRNVQRDI